MARTRNCALLFALALTFTLSIVAADDERDDAGTKTRFGTLSVVEDETEPILRILTLDGKEIHRYDGMVLSVEAVYSTKSLDIALVIQGSGGNACAATYIIVQLEAEKPPLLSKEFGTCSDIPEIRLEKEALIIEMPRYVNHPELWDEKELDEALSTKLIYTWSKGKLREKTVKK